MSSFSSRYHSPELFDEERRLARRDSRRRANQEARGMSELAEVDVYVVRLTDRGALLQRYALGQVDQQWVPRSCIQDGDELVVDSSQSVTLQVALWKLNELGWA